MVPAIIKKKKSDHWKFRQNEECKNTYKEEEADYTDEIFGQAATGFRHGPHCTLESNNETKLERMDNNLLFNMKFRSKSCIFHSEIETISPLQDRPPNRIQEILR